MRWIIVTAAALASGCIGWPHHRHGAGSFDCCASHEHASAGSHAHDGKDCCGGEGSASEKSAPKSASGTQVVAPASEKVKKEVWDALAARVGEWEITAEDGKVVPVLSVRMTSGGTAIQETIFPGSEHEMLNVYHLDGDSVLLTHFCHAGNQPRMRAKEAKNGTIEFVSDGCSNLTSAKDGFMGSMTLVLKDADTMEQTWYWWENGTSKPGFAGTYKRKK